MTDKEVFKAKVEAARNYLNNADDVNPRLAYSALRACVMKCVEALEELTKEDV